MRNPVIKPSKLSSRQNSLKLLALILAVLPLLSACAGHRTILNEDKSVSGKIKGSVEKPKRDALLVWFVKADGEKIDYKPVARTYQPNSMADSEQPGSEQQTPVIKAVEAAVGELLKGPTAEEEASGLGSEVPKGTVLISVGPGKDEGIVVDLSRRFLSGSGAESFELRLEQLKRTVNEVVSHDKPEKVFLNVEGERLSQATGDGIDVAQPINQ